MRLSVLNPNVRIDNFRFAHQPGPIAITSYKPSHRGLMLQAFIL